MQRKPNIKWRKSDVERMQREVNRFNAKIERVKRAHPELIDILPKRVDKAEFMNNITTRQDYNREIKSLERFSARGAEKPVVAKSGNTVTRWERKEVGYKIAQINRERARLRQEYKLERPNMQMGTRKQNELNSKPYDFDKIRKGKEWEKLKETIDKQVRANYEGDKVELYKRNYLTNIQNNLGEAGDELYNFINRIPADVLYNIYWEDDEMLKIQFTSDPLPSDVIADLSLEAWRERLDLEEGEDYDDYIARMEEVD